MILSPVSRQPETDSKSTAMHVAAVHDIPFMMNLRASDYTRHCQIRKVAIAASSRFDFRLKQGMMPLPKQDHRHSITGGPMAEHRLPTLLALPLCLALLGRCSSSNDSPCLLDLRGTSDTSDVQADGLSNECQACPGQDACPCQQCDLGPDSEYGDVASDTLPCPSCDCDLTQPPVGLCETVAQDRAAEELRSIHGLAFNKAVAVIQAQLGTPYEVNGTFYAPAKVTGVLRGLQFLTGLDVLIPIHQKQTGTVAGESFYVALSSSMPMMLEAAGKLAWHNTLSLIPMNEGLPSDTSILLRRLSSAWIAEVRISAQDDYRTTFQVVDALKGTLPVEFQDNWYASWQLPYPAPSDQTYIAVVEGLTQYDESTGPYWLGTVVHLEAATDAVRQYFQSQLPGIPQQGQADPASARDDQYLNSFTFRVAPFVANSIVSGRAMECCTGAGGIYISHQILEPLSGALESGKSFVTGGHAYYGEEECGEGYLVALDNYLDPATLATLPVFDCLAWPAAPEWQAWDPIESSVLVQMEWSPAQQTLVEQWVKASRPLYQVFLPEAQVTAQQVEQQPGNAPWSWPLDAADALRFATDVALITIESASVNPETGLHEVTFSTTLSTYELEHLTRYTFKLAFECGDPRLSQVGARWVVGLLRLDHWIPQNEMPDVDRMFLIPGAILPEEEVTLQLESVLGYAQ